MLHGKFTMFVDQWGNRWTACTLRELHKQIGGGFISKMYEDDSNGKTYHVGYIIRNHWCRAYAPVRIPQE